MASAARSGHHHSLGAVTWLLWVLVGCSASYPDGKISCDDVTECPSGFTCRARAAGGTERFCFSSAAAEVPDSGPQPGTSTAAVGGNEAATGSSEVVPASDGGPKPSTGGSGGSGTNAGAGQGGAGSAAISGDASMDGAVADEAGTETPDAGHCNEATAECEPGDEQPESRDCECGRTQARTNTCSDSCTWVEGAWGECDLSGVECLPGDTMPEERACECGRTQSRTMTCSDSCTWGGGAWGECDLAGVQCKPGQTQMQTVACASCGTRVQQRGCAATSCTWGGWSDISSACASSCDDCAEVQFCEAPANQPNPGGTKCRQTSRACTREQALADCQADIPVVCGTVHQPFYMEYL